MCSLATSINGVAVLTGFFYNIMYGHSAGPKKVAAITR